jgi:hypothetical protein
MVGVKFKKLGEYGQAFLKIMYVIGFLRIYISDGCVIGVRAWMTVALEVVPGPGLCQ